MNKTIEFSINKKNNGERLDVFLSKEIKNLTRSYIKKLIEKKNVRLNKSIKLHPQQKLKQTTK
jgi:23S rRNA pseudouridine1911/1915/1917 synthase